MWGIELLQNSIIRQVGNYGAGVIVGAIANSPIGVGFAAMNAFSGLIEGGMVESVVPAALNFRFQGNELFSKLGEAVSQMGVAEKEVGPGKKKFFKRAAWQRSRWASSREQWMQDAWKHDWRSQPRNRIGEWIPGRLDHPVANAPRVGKGVQTTSRQRRRINRYRRYGRLAARSIKYGS